jgi:hypothetical protein
MMCGKSVSRPGVESSARGANGQYEAHERCVSESPEDVTDAETLPPDQALALLGNETRIAILRVIASADEETVPFSILRERVGIDDSGQFNYHLNKLTGYYVRRTTDGYALHQTGTDALEVISLL